MAKRKNKPGALERTVAEILKRDIRLWVEGSRLKWAGNVDRDLELQIRRLERDLVRRTRIPNGWPELVPVPDWWPGPWLSTEVFCAVQSECGHCGGRVCLVVFGESGFDYRCANCMHKLMPVQVDESRLPLETTADKGQVVQTKHGPKAA